MKNRLLLFTLILLSTRVVDPNALLVETVFAQAAAANPTRVVVAANVPAPAAGDTQTASATITAAAVTSASAGTQQTALPLTQNGTADVTTNGTATASAPHNDGFTIVPAYPNAINERKFLFEIKPGEKSEDYAYIKNLSDQPVTFQLYGADPTVSNRGTLAYKTRQQNGIGYQESICQTWICLFGMEAANLYTRNPFVLTHGICLSCPTETNISGTGQWVKFDNPQIDLGPKETRLEHFTMMVPPATPFGDYKAGITMEKSKKDIYNPGITIATRVILHSEIHVTPNPHPIPKKDGPQPVPTAGWPVYYFWISFVAFAVSLSLLVWSLVCGRHCRK